MTLAEARKKVDLTQEEAALKLKISRSLVGLIELGRRRPRFGLAKRMARLYKQPINVLFFDYEGFKMNQKTGIA